MDEATERIRSIFKMGARKPLKVPVGLGRGFGHMYMRAVEFEYERRTGGNMNFHKVLFEYGLGIQYLEDEEDYFYLEGLHHEYQLNVKWILHFLEMLGFENAARAYDSPRYQEVLKGWPVENNPKDGDGWVRLLLSDATQGARCPWDMLDGWNWAELLAERPEFAPFCAWDKLNSHDWSYLLLATPDFDARCDFSLFDGVDWSYLVQQRPELAVHLNLEELNDRDRSRIERVLGIPPPKTYHRI